MNRIAPSVGNEITNRPKISRLGRAVRVAAAVVGITAAGFTTIGVEAYAQQLHDQATAPVVRPDHQQYQPVQDRQLEGTAQMVALAELTGGAVVALAAFGVAGSNIDRRR